MRHRLAGVLCALSACSLNVDYTGTLFACDPDGACPAHYVCQNLRCVPTEPPPAECFAAVGAGDSHSCAIRSDGTAWCWGSNSFGQLGDGTTDDQIEPVAVTAASGAKLPRFKAIAGGAEHTCALGADGTVWCWGHNLVGQLGNGSTSDYHAAVAVANLSGAIAIASGAAHTCAIGGDGGVVCWGDNEAGQIGNNGTANVSQPQTAGGPRGVTAIAAGGDATCAIDGNKQLWCWGDNGHGQLADGSHNPHVSPNPAVLHDVAGVAVGNGFSCALSSPASGGKVTCFGINNIGQLGTPVDNAEHVAGVTIAFAGTAVSVVARTDFACLIDDQKRVWCWGDNEDFQLADTTSDDRFVPVLTSYGQAASVVAGGGHTCALSPTGGVTCSGYNGRGQLGNGRRTSQATPHRVAGIQDAVAVSAGQLSTCATVHDGTVRCWGGNDRGSLGDGTSISRAHPAPVSALGGVQQVADGFGHACAVTQGIVECWGANNNGQLGDATNYTRGYPLTVPGLTGATGVDAGGNTTCAVAGGAVSCWGQGSAGQLGTGSLFDVNAPVGVMLPKSDATAIAVGDGHACAIHADKTVSCWGAGGGGQLGNNAFANSTLPVAVSDLGGVDQIVAAAGFTCAHTGDGNVWCWGAADNGELGFDINHNIAAPGQVTGLSGTTKIDAGGSHACAIRSGGALACWGASFFGEVGDGGHDRRGMPVGVTMPGNAGVVDVSAGEIHTCAVLVDGSVACWGDDRFGQLGDGILADQVPVAPALVCP
jgi:alpha-tubulin suppressor-like RCC1 family protein